MARFAKGFVEYRLGNHASAVESFENSAEICAKRTGGNNKCIQAAALLFAAMAARESGSRQEDILKSLAEVTRLIRRLPVTSPQDEWLVNEWLVLKIARRQVEPEKLGGLNEQLEGSGND